MHQELKEASAGIGSYNALHAMDYMVYAHLQLGQDRAARAPLDEIAAIQSVDIGYFPAAYAFAAMPARYALEHRDWKAAANLKLHPATLPWQQFPQSEAVTVFARALGKARTGDSAGARSDLERLKVLREVMLKNKAAYWAQQADIQIATVSAMLAFAEGKHEEGLLLMRTATDMETATDKHPVTPGPLVPAPELLGEMLLELGRPREALADFEAVQKIEPNRLLAIYNAGRAAELSKGLAKARTNYGDLLTLTAKRDVERPETTHAKAKLKE
jgi:tetratricopeptide (TPR) repeat protein